MSSEAKILIFPQPYILSSRCEIKFIAEIMNMCICAHLELTARTGRGIFVKKGGGGQQEWFGQKRQLVSYLSSVPP